MDQRKPEESIGRTSTLIVTADDFGHTTGANRAIVESLRRGYVTHASLIVNLAGFDDACELMRAEGLESSVGLHLNFTDGVPLTDGMKRSTRFCVDGHFRYPMLGRGLSRLSAPDQQLVREEASAQFARARTAGCPIVHLDSHHHVHVRPNLAGVLLTLAKSLGVPRVRRFSNCGPDEGWFRRLRGAVYTRQLERAGHQSTRYFGDIDDMRWMIANGKSLEGSIEIMTHPGLGPQGAIVDGRDSERLSERILALRPHLPSLIDKTGRISRAQ
jgi:chitin disaccharide deacetylase